MKYTALPSRTQVRQHVFRRRVLLRIHGGYVQSPTSFPGCHEQITHVFARVYTHTSRVAAYIPSRIPLLIAPTEYLFYSVVQAVPNGTRPSPTPQVHQENFVQCLIESKHPGLVSSRRPCEHKLEVSVTPANSWKHAVYRITPSYVF